MSFPSPQGERWGSSRRPRTEATAPWPLLFFFSNRRRLFALAALLLPAGARAQVHWDASAQAGATRRVLAGRPSGGGDATVGPSAHVTGHVALVPLLRVGGYVGHELSPLSGDGPSRHLTTLGGRLKAVLPWLRGSWRAWAFTGFGYAAVYAPSHTRSLGEPPLPRRVEGASGGFFEVPLGVGASYRLSKPWELSAELGARVGFGHGGAVYEPEGTRGSLPGLPEVRVAPAGLDRFAVGLTLGVTLDR